MNLTIYSTIAVIWSIILLYPIGKKEWKSPTKETKESPLSTIFILSLYSILAGALWPITAPIICVYCAWEKTDELLKRWMTQREKREKEKEPCAPRACVAAPLAESAQPTPIEQPEEIVYSRA